MSVANNSYGSSDQWSYPCDDNASLSNTFAAESNCDTYEGTLDRHHPSTPPQTGGRQKQPQQQQQQQQQQEQQQQQRNSASDNREFTEQANAFFYEDEILFGNNPNRDYFRYFLENERELKGDDSIVGYSTQEDIINNAKLQLESKWEQMAAYSVDAGDTLSRATPFSASVESASYSHQKSHGKWTFTRSQPPSIGEDQLYLEKLERGNFGKQAPHSSRTPTTLSPSTSGDERGADVPSVIYALDDDGNVTETRLSSVLSPTLVPPPQHPPKSYSKSHKHSRSKHPRSRDSSEEIRRNRRMIVVLFVLLIVLVTGFCTALLVVFLGAGNASAPVGSPDESTGVAPEKHNDFMPSPPVSILVQPTPQPVSTQPSVSVPSEQPSVPVQLPSLAPVDHLEAKLPSPLVFGPPLSPTLGPASVPTPLPTMEPSITPSLAPVGNQQITTAAPSVAATPAPSEKEVDPLFEDLRIYLSDMITYDNGTALWNASSSQYRALEWLAEDPKVEEYTGVQKTQRYVLAALFYSTNGEEWFESDKWLSYDDSECTWFTGLRANQAVCDAEGVFRNLDLRTNNLRGPLPPDMQLMTGLERIHLLENGLSGTIPTSLGELGMVRRLQLTRNQFTGTIPSELVKMSSLEVLGLGRNLLTGALPENMGDLQNLGTLGLERNSLVGSIPASLKTVTSLVLLALDHNFLSGDIGGLWSTPNLQTVSLQRNDLNGSAVAAGFCGLDAAVVSADCEEIECPCCAACCVDDGRCELP